MKILLLTLLTIQAISATQIYRQNSRNGSWGWTQQNKTEMAEYDTLNLTATEDGLIMLQHLCCRDIRLCVVLNDEEWVYLPMVYYKHFLLLKEDTLTIIIDSVAANDDINRVSVGITWTTLSSLFPPISIYMPTAASNSPSSSNRGYDIAGRAADGGRHRIFNFKFR